MAEKAMLERERHVEAMVAKKAAKKAAKQTRRRSLFTKTRARSSSGGTGSSKALRKTTDEPKL